MKNLLKQISFMLLALLMFSCASYETADGKQYGFGREPSWDTESTGESTSDSVEAPPVVPKSVTVCVDPGHGFKDIGTSSDLLAGTNEKEVVLDIAKHLGDILAENGYDVIFTHNGSEFPKTAIDDGDNIFEPDERVAYANSQNIDFFISIHCDSYPSDQSVSGTRVYYYDQSGADSANRKRQESANQIAQAVDGVLSHESKTRVVPMKQAYEVIRTTKVTALLVETGFVTNPTDAANMQSAEWRENMAKAIFLGIDRYFTPSEK